MITVINNFLWRDKTVQRVLSNYELSTNTHIHSVSEDAIESSADRQRETSHPK